MKYIRDTFRYFTQKENHWKVAALLIAVVVLAGLVGANKVVAVNQTVGIGNFPFIVYKQTRRRFL